MTTPLIVSWLSLFAAVAALLVAVANLWLSQLRRGMLQLSTPTIFYFGWDRLEASFPKIMFRSALFATAKRGIIVESLYLKVRSSRGETTFSFWGYDAGSGMVRGSGVYVDEKGFLANHHFNPPAETATFSYGTGKYIIEIWARRVDRGADEKLGSYNFEVPKDTLAVNLMVDGDGLLWDWLPEQRTYVPVVKHKRPVSNVHDVSRTIL